MSRYTTTSSPEPNDDEDDQDLPQIPLRRPRREAPRFIKAEFSSPEHYEEFRRAGIPSNALELLEEFLKQFPSHEEIARWEARGIEITGWVNQQLYEVERLCLRIDALTQNFESLENIEVLVNQVRSKTSDIKLLQAKLDVQQMQLDDRLFPWLTKSNLRKNGFTAIAFFLFVATAVLFVKNGNGSSTSNPNNPNPQSSSVPTSATQAEPKAN
jgi:hypothetical protein